MDRFSAQAREQPQRDEQEACRTRATRPNRIKFVEVRCGNEEIGSYTLEADRVLGMRVEQSPTLPVLLFVSEVGVVVTDFLHTSSEWQERK